MCSHSSHKEDWEYSGGDILRMTEQPQDGVSGQRDELEWSIGRFAALSVLLIGVSTFVEQVPAFFYILTPNGLLFVVFSPLSSPLFLYIGYITVALMLLAGVVLFIGLRKGEGEPGITAVSIAALIAYSAITFPGEFSYGHGTGFTVAVNGHGPVQQLLILSFGYFPRGVVLYSALLAFAWIAIIATIYLVARLSYLKVWGKIFLSLTILSVAAAFLLAVSLVSLAPYLFFAAVPALHANYLSNVFASLMYGASFLSMAIPIGCFLIYRLHRKSGKRPDEGTGPEGLQNPSVE